MCRTCRWRAIWGRRTTHCVRRWRNTSSGPRPRCGAITRGLRRGPLVIYAEFAPRLLRWRAKSEIRAEPGVHGLDGWVLAGETIRPDARRLFRSRPGPSRWQNPLAEPDGQPGVVFRWLEV